MSAITVALPTNKDLFQTLPHQTDKSFRSIISGAKAFYKQTDYFTKTSYELSQKKILPVTYVSNTESKIITVAKLIFSIIVFPIGIYHLLHALGGKLALLPASTPSLMGHPSDIAEKWRSQIDLHTDLKFKRFTVGVDGYKIDAMIVGKEATFNNGRWILASNGNGEFYEGKLFYSHDFNQILTEFKGNAIVFNYPGVGSSSGLPNRNAMAKAYRAMLHFLEDKNKGIGANEIIGFGHSIGGGVQGDALKGHQFKKDVKYVFVKSRTFSDLSKTASILTNKFLGLLVKVLGWNMDCVTTSKKLPMPEVILQTAHVNKYTVLTESSKIRKTDGIIPLKSSLAKILLDDASCPKHNKVFIGIPEMHNDGLRNPAFIAKHVQQLLMTQ